MKIRIITGDVIVVSRHPAFLEFLKEIGLVDENTPIISHADPSEISGKTVITSGIPLHLAALAKRVITVDLALPPELRGEELTVEDMKKYLKGITEYEVRKIKTIK